MSFGVTPPAEDAARLAQSQVQSLYRTDHASRSLGVEIIDVAPGRVRTEMTVRGDMVNGHGICHGGIIFALADSAFAFACNTYGIPMVAAGASIEFLAPAMSGERLAAAANEISRNDRHGLYDVCVTNGSGRTIAHFRGRCSRLRKGASIAG
jgi:acyl-CoA thioesterase